MLESAGALVMVTDTEGRIVRFNLACQRTSGYSADEVRGKSCWELLTPPEERQAGRQVYRELLETGVQQVNESHLTDRQGGRRLISWANTVFTDPHRTAPFVTRIGGDITVRRQAEEALQRGELNLRRNQDQLRTLAAGLVQGQEEERRRISLELHDDISQRLAAMALDVYTLQRGQTAMPHGVSAGLEEVLVGLKVLAEDVHRTARQLHPSVLEQFGLGPALKSHCEEFSRRTKLKLQFSQRNVPEGIPVEVALSLYRIAQEAMANAAKHAGARRLEVSVASRDGALELSVRDNGQGFDPDNPGGKGLGLISIHEQVRQAGGRLSIESKPGAGTLVSVLVPLVPTSVAASEKQSG